MVHGMDWSPKVWTDRSAPCPTALGVSHEITGGHAVRVSDHDFNNGRTEAGFHEVVLDANAQVHRDEVVDVTDGEIVMRGRVRCLVAIVEDIK